MANTVNDFKVNDNVIVHAFGGDRRGYVVKVGKTRVTVNFVRNMQGERDERPFPASDVKHV
jgi:hypothetical protein